MPADKHDRYKIEVNFTICDGLRDKGLEEVKELLNYINNPKTLDHASDLKVYVHHESMGEIKAIEEPKENQNG